MQPEAVLLGLGYPVSVAVVFRFVPVVKERRWRWLFAHHLGVAAVVTGWAVRGEVSAAAANASWLAASSLWYVLGGKKQEEGTAGNRHAAAAVPSMPRRCGVADDELPRLGQ